MSENIGIKIYHTLISTRFSEFYNSDFFSVISLKLMKSF